MTGDDYGRLAYLVLLGAAVGGYFLVAERRNIGKLFRQAALWGLIFLGVIAGFGLWGDIRDDVVPRQSYVAEEGRIEVPRSPDGHYYLTLRVNDAPIRFVVDTGASQVVLTQEDARRAGIDPGSLAYVGRAHTANGLVSTAPVTLQSVELGPVSDARVRAQVNGGEMRESLLGMSYLDRYGSLEIRDGRLILTR
ncbi:MAG: TIGR02281 family clan AA aspartic protease [Pseudomonadota bacterium]